MPDQATAPAMGDEQRIDEIVTALYRRFKDWSQRGFTSDDVTWCEVRADVVSLVGLQDAQLTAAQTRANRLDTDVLNAERENEELRMRLIAAQTRADELKQHLDAARAELAKVKGSRDGKS